MINVILVTFVVLLKSDLDVQQTVLRGWFLEKKVKLKSNSDVSQTHLKPVR
jgi:hypothetical protein